MTHKRSPSALLVLNPHRSHRASDFQSSDRAPLLSDLHEASCGAGRRGGGRRRRMNWIGRKIHLYNVTIGLYMLDWWERYLFICKRGYPAVKGAMMHVPGHLELAMPSTINSSASVHGPSFASLPPQTT